MYRPQFAFRKPVGSCEEHRCHFSYDASNTPALVSVAAGANLTKIPLRMDQDAPFYLRAIQATPSGLQIRLEDCFDNPLLGKPVVADALTGDVVVNPSFWCETDGGVVVPLESDDWGVFCPAGGVLLLYVVNPTAAPITTFVLTLHGVKWYQEGSCS